MKYFKQFIMLIALMLSALSVQANTFYPPYPANMMPAYPPAMSYPAYPWMTTPPNAARSVPLQSNPMFPVRPTLNTVKPNPYMMQPQAYGYPNTVYPNAMPPMNSNNAYAKAPATTSYPNYNTQQYPVANQQNNMMNRSPMYQKKPPVKKKKKPWGDTRYIWPDFYTDSTGDMWDAMINAPYDMGRMPGGWRFPSLSSPDPVTVGDAVANQVPPVMDEVPNFMPFLNN